MLSYGQGQCNCCDVSAHLLFSWLMSGLRHQHPGAKCLSRTYQYTILYISYCLLSSDSFCIDKHWNCYQARYGFCKEILESRSIVKDKMFTLLINYDLSSISMPCKRKHITAERHDIVYNAIYIIKYDGSPLC